MRERTPTDREMDRVEQSTRENSQARKKKGREVDGQKAGRPGLDSERQVKSKTR